MKIKSSLFVAVLLSLYVVSVVSAFDLSAIKTIEDYTQKQFEAYEDDMLQSEYAKFSKLTPSLKEHVVDGVLYDFRHDPFAVVSSYRILDVKIDEKKRKGTANIEYTRIGRGETYRFKNSPHTKLILEPLAKEVVTLELTFDGKKWFVKDPGMPYVSCVALKRVYSEYQAGLQKRFERHMGASLKKGGYNDRIQNDYSEINRMSCE